MFVGVSRIVLQLPGARTLKDKRMIVRSFKERTLARMRVSIAEVGELDLIQKAVLGVAVVSNDAAVCDEVLANVGQAASTLRDAVLVDRTTEIVPFGDVGPERSLGEVEGDDDA